MNVNLPELKDGWGYVPLVDWMGFVKTGVKEFKGPVSYYSTGSVSINNIKVEKVVTYDNRPTRANRFVQIGDVLQSRMKGTNKPVLVDENIQSTLFSTGFVQFRPDNQTLSRYLYLFFNSELFLQQKNALSTGSTQVSINDSNFKKIMIPKPNDKLDLDTICDEIESSQNSFNRVSEIVTITKSNIEKLTNSFLESACTGKLVTTEAELARKENRQYESAKQLLETILTERHMRFKSENPNKKYSEPSKPLENELPNLPEGWCWATVEQVGDVQLGRQRAPKYHSGENMHPYLRVANVLEAKIDSSDVMTMVFDEKDYEKYKLSEGDILLNEGQSPEYLGRPAIFRGEVQGACFTNTLIRYRPFHPLVPEYWLAVFRFYMRSRKFGDVGSITTNIAHLGVKKFSNMSVPIPPLSEMFRISEAYTSFEKNIREIEMKINELNVSTQVIERLLPNHWFVS